MYERFCVDENKVLEAKKILVFKNKKVFSTIFNLFKDDIKNVISRIF